MGWWWVYLDYNISSGPSLSYEIEIGDGPGPELDNKDEEGPDRRCLGNHYQPVLRRWTVSHTLVS